MEVVKISVLKTNLLVTIKYLYDEIIKAPSLGGLNEARGLFGN